MDVTATASQSPNSRVIGCGASMSFAAVNQDTPASTPSDQAMPQNARSLIPESSTAMGGNLDQDVRAHLGIRWTLAFISEALADCSADRGTSGRYAADRIAA